MKKPIKLSCFLLFLIVLVSISCKKNETTTPEREKFLGKWGVHENHNKGDFEVTISADPNESSRVFIYNFAAQLPENKATAVISGNSITLDANQSVGEATNLHGSGTMSGTTTINWTYSFFQGGDQNNATAVYTKK